MIRFLVVMITFFMLATPALAVDKSLGSYDNVTPAVNDEYLIETAVGTRNVLQSVLNTYYATLFALTGHNHSGTYLEAETDPGVATHESTYTHVNFNTAYGWGNHADAGYLTAEVDGSITNEIELTADELAAVQGAALPSGTNVFATIADVGTGGGGTWGSITGTLSAQTDLQGALDAKVATTDTPAWDKNAADDFSGAYVDLTGKPTLGTAAAKNIPATGNASATEVVYGTDTRMADARTPTAHNNTAHSETYLNTDHTTTHPAPTTRDARNQVAGDYATGAEGDLASTALQSESDPTVADAVSTHNSTVQHGTTTQEAADISSNNSHRTTTGNAHSLSIVDLFTVQLAAHPRSIWYIEGYSTTGSCVGDVTWDTTTQTQLNALIADVVAAGGTSDNTRVECMTVATNAFAASDGYIAFSGDSAEMLFRGGEFPASDGFIAFSGDLAAFIQQGGDVFPATDGFIAFSGDNAVMVFKGGRFDASKGFIAVSGDSAELAIPFALLTTTSASGRIYNTGTYTIPLATGDLYPAVRDATSGSVVQINAATMFLGTENEIINGGESEYKTSNVRRSFLFFDLSSVPAGKTITLAEVRLNVLSLTDAGSLVAQQGTQADTLTVADYSAFTGAVFGTTAITTGAMTITLDASGRSYLTGQIGGTAKLAVRESLEAAGSGPAENTKAGTASLSGPADTTPSLRPALYIEWE